MKNAYVKSVYRDFPFAERITGRPLITFPEPTTIKIFTVSWSPQNSNSQSSANPSYASIKLYRDNTSDVVFTETNSTKGWQPTLSTFTERHVPIVIDDGLIVEGVTTLGVQGALIGISFVSITYQV